MNRFSGTVIPAPTHIELLTNQPHMPAYLVSWSHPSHIHADVEIVFRNGVGNVKSFYQDRSCLYAPIPQELLVESAILNVQARLK